MRILPLLIVTMLLQVSYGYAQRNVRIGFLDLDKVLKMHKGYSASSQELEAKINTWRSEIETKQKKLEDQQRALDLERPLITQEIYEERAEDIAFEQEQLDAYIEKRFGVEGDWIKQKVLLAQPAQDEILTAIREVADNRKLDYVFDSTADILVLHSEKKYDISELVIRYIEIEDKKKAQELLSKTKKEETRQRSNPTEDEKRNAIEKRRADREKLLKERKALKEQKIKERAEELARSKKEKAEAVEKRKREQAEALERRKKELEEKRKQAQQKK